LAGCNCTAKAKVLAFPYSILLTTVASSIPNGKKIYRYCKSAKFFRDAKRVKTLQTYDKKLAQHFNFGFKWDGGVGRVAGVRSFAA
jgi:hypothetical protein